MYGGGWFCGCAGLYETSGLVKVLAGRLVGGYVVEQCRPANYIQSLLSTYTDSVLPVLCCSAGSRQLNSIIESPTESICRSIF